MPYICIGQYWLTLRLNQLFKNEVLPLK